MKPPILVISDDVYLFRSARDAERHLEAPEVRAGVRIFDSEGRPIRARVTRRFLAEAVKLEQDTASLPDVPALRAGLIRLIGGGKPNEDEALSRLSLNELLSKGEEYFT